MAAALRRRAGGPRPAQLSRPHRCGEGRGEQTSPAPPAKRRGAKVAPRPPAPNAAAQARPAPSAAAQAPPSSFCGCAVELRV